MRLRYTKQAAGELAAILDYLKGQSPQGASRVQLRIRAAERLLALFPEAGEVTRLPWLRRIVTSPYPYLIFYEVRESEIVIHRVRHGGRAPPTFR